MTKEKQLTKEAIEAIEMILIANAQVNKSKRDLGDLLNDLLFFYARLSNKNYINMVLNEQEYFIKRIANDYYKKRGVKNDY